MAKIVFNDGTNYTVKQDSLIVIEENSANERQQTEGRGQREYRNRGPGYRDVHARFAVAKSLWMARPRRWRRRAPPA